MMKSRFSRSLGVIAATVAEAAAVADCVTGAEAGVGCGEEVQALAMAATANEETSRRIDAPLEIANKICLVQRCAEMTAMVVRNPYNVDSAWACGGVTLV